MANPKLALVMATAEQKAAFYKTPLPKDFKPRLAKYARDMLDEGFHVEDLNYAVDRIIAGGHSPFLIRSFVHDRLGTSKESTAESAWADFPDF